MMLMLLMQFPDVDALPARPGLPDPLVMLEGTKVTTPDQWRQKRRPELQALFEHYMYGKAPAPVPVKATVVSVDPAAFGGKATRKDVALSFGPPGTPEVDLLIVVPNKRDRPAPVFLGPNFCGNHAVMLDPGVRIPRSWLRKGEGKRGGDSAVWEIENTIDRGWAVATFYYGDVDPDRDDFTDGVHPHFPNHDWGSIAAWAWGVQRVVDALVTDKDLDAKRIAAFGHSRLGKTVLLAAAFDERIGLVIPHQAGCGGTAPSRCANPKGEKVKGINKNFPHWFNDTFPRFDDQVEKLPFDQNCLVALVAPRPVLFTNGAEDQWADPGGQFDVLKAADPVYRFLGVEGLAASEMPSLGKLMDSRVGYYIREGPHVTDKGYWNVFIDFASKHLK